MNQKVENFIAEKEEELALQKKKAKKALALRLGLTYKKYSKTKKWNSKYPLYDYEYQGEGSPYYRDEPIALTDEEYEGLKKYDNENDIFHKSNGYATFLLVIAFLIIGIGFIYGFVAASDSDLFISAASRNEDFSVITLLYYWGVSLVSSAIFFGMAAIIDLLHDINHKMK